VPLATFKGFYIKGRGGEGGKGKRKWEGNERGGTERNELAELLSTKKKQCSYISA